MSQTKTAAKTTRAFRTISEAGEELDLQPHVLRFWESKFPQIKPIKRGGGRRFYRPDDIEFLRGIKTLLHDEKHPIKDVQKLIQKKGASRITELGRSVEQASRDRRVADTDLLPTRIKTPAPVTTKARTAPVPKPTPSQPAPVVEPVTSMIPEADQEAGGMTPAPEPLTPTVDKSEVLDALARLEALKGKWGDFRKDSDPT